MTRWLIRTCIFITIVLLAGCGGNQFPEKLEVSFEHAKNYEGNAMGTAVINTKIGTEVHLKISGLEQGKVYTAFFVNIKSQMFQGIGEDPFTLAVNPNGEVDLTAQIPKDSYKRYTKLAIYLNPGGKPIKNPVGVKAKLGAVLKTEKPKMVLVATLR